MIAEYFKRFGLCSNLQQDDLVDFLLSAPYCELIVAEGT